MYAKRAVVDVCNPMTTRQVFTALALIFLALGALAPETRAANDGGARWTDTTPDAMIDAQKTSAVGAKATEKDALAAVATIAAIEPRATYGRAQKALEEIGANGA